jgi:hypothetical protein
MLMRFSYSDVFSVNAWAILNMFLDSRDKTWNFEELSGDNIHGLTNVITMNLDAYLMFDHLRFWLLPSNVRKYPGSLGSFIDDTLFVANRELT